jgi:aminoglycoside N3'-acetyltransferase
MNISRSILTEELRTLGLTTGDHVMMHSSPSSFGHLEGGADALLDACLKSLVTMNATFTDAYL